jgi:hypothetical protein
MSLQQEGEGWLINMITRNRDWFRPVPGQPIRSAIKTAVAYTALGVGGIVGAVAMLIVMVNLMDISAERGVYIDGRWTPTGGRRCDQRAVSPVMLSYWFTCEHGEWIPRLRKDRA